MSRRDDLAVVAAAIPRPRCAADGSGGAIGPGGGHWDRDREQRVSVDPGSLRVDQQDIGMRVAIAVVYRRCAA
jgi:hypothetical protein